jgi:hypothetical protein
LSARINPFFELYVNDRMSSREFVDMFSPFLVRHAEALFLPGNVVVKGVQGSGKSMLLSLLKPEVRLEYSRAGADFPVPVSLSRFIGAGINLAHQNAIDFGYRQISDDPRETALFFADFVNYTILVDLFATVRKFAESAQTGTELGISLDAGKERAIVSALSSNDVFEGVLSGCSTIDGLEERMRERLNGYRRFLHHNAELDPQVRRTKTDIGTPISEVVKILKRSGALPEDVAVFVHIDQYEELANLSTTETNSPDYRRVINRALARRDPHISYRIGTRGHAWRDHGYIQGVEAKLEEERDYKFVDLDSMLRRNEDRKTWIFPGFVADVFSRRLGHVGLAPKGSDGKRLLVTTLGSGLKPPEKAKRYGGRSPARSVKTDKEWPEQFKSGIEELAVTDPLSARLLEAWVLQRLDRAPNGRRQAAVEALDMSEYEAMRAKEWWNKERIDLALIQIAARCQERPIWCGHEEVMALSGGSILTFLSLCQFIWDAHNQFGTASSAAEGSAPVDPGIQAVAVFKASQYWLRKIGTETGRSGDRQRLVREIGTVLAKELYSDRNMSYPGRNGFTLADEELERYPHVKSLLEEMSDYGTLVAWPHTTKEKDRRARTKFYLNPVLCPQFKIHFKRLKEPLYIDPRTVESWMSDAGLPVPASHRQAAQRPTQTALPLFEDDGDR